MTTSDESVKGKITGFKCSKSSGDNFPKKSFYVKITVKRETKGFKTSRVKGGGSVLSWDDSFFLGDSGLTGSSTIRVEMFQRRYFRKNKSIGAFEDSIGSLLKEGASEVSRELRKADSNVPSPANITFSISALSHDADIIDLRTEEVLPQARHALSEMKSVPSALETTEAVAGMVAQAADTAKSFGDVWSSLIKTLTIVTEITDKLAEVRSSFSDLKSVSLKFLNNKVHPYAQTACMILSVVPKIIIAQKNCDDAVYNLMGTIDDIHSFVKDAKPLESIESHRKVFVALGSLTVECAYLIRDYSMDKNFWVRIANLTWYGVESKIKQYEDKFKDLKAQFQGSALVNIDITAMRCLREVENISEKIKSIDTSLIFNDLPYAADAGFDPDKSCIRGTRKAALNEIHQWINEKDGDDTGQILVLTGDAGVGKSAIANTIAQHYKAEKRLGSFVSFNRADQEKRNPRNLLSTVARDIADLDPNWKSALYDAVKDDHSLRKTTSPILQMKSFVLEPAKALAIVGPIVIVIDALDESGDASTRKPLFKALAENASKLPRNFRILITARPEDDILKLSEKLPNSQHQTIKTTDEAMDADISTYMRKELFDYEEDLQGNLRCANGAGINMLVKGSGHLFEWAATACRVIQNRRKGSSPAGVLLDIVDNGGDLDELYARILSQTFDAKAMPRFRRVLGGILAVKEPLPMASHSAIQRSEAEEEDIVSMIVGPLGSLLHGVDPNESPQVSIRARHTSFFDFLTDKKRSGEFFVDATKQDQNLVLGCLRIMKEELRFNPCGLETSHLRNADVPDLPALVQTHITPHLLYACRFIGVHLQTTSYEKQVGSELKDFLQEHFLYWLEILSLTKFVNTASRSLSSILKWSQSHNPDLTAFAKDAKMFVNVFAPAISQSAPHIYLSALPFAPTQSLVSRQYLPKYPSTIHLKSGSVQRWPAALKTLEGHESDVRAVAYSPDGKHIVSGSADDTIRIWDAETGEAVGEQLRGHSSSIMAIAYSPDGRHIVSGSWDGTIRIWDAETGESVGEPLIGHTEGIRAIACSSNGAHIISGSDDNTIRRWDAVTGKAVGEPLRGHTEPIYAVAYSLPDGRHIVSGSGDNTLRIWAAETGEAVGEPLRGHTATIYCVAYSPDSKHIISGSSDGTIRIWDAKTGEAVGKPIHRSAGENTLGVCSVACSPDGKHIVSGWTDGIICVWDAETGEAIGEPFEGHTSDANCVAYSPDGTGIVSCSDDGTVRVWNAEKSEAAGAQVAENTSEWNFVTYSPGGTRIVSASAGGMICVWDAETGSAVADSLKRNVGHEHHTMATTFSSDGMRVVSCDRSGGIQTWDSETGQPVRDTIKLEPSSDCYNAAFSYNGTRIAVRDSGEVIRVFDAETGKAVGMSSRKYSGMFKKVSCVIYSPGGTHIALGFEDGMVHVWDPEAGKEVEWTSSKWQTVNSIAYSPDGKRLVVGSDDCEIRLWNTETYTSVGGPLKGHTKGVMTVVWSPDGKYIISGSRDQTIRVWNAETGEAVGGPLRGHSGPVTSIAYSPDGTRFASASTDKTIRFWDAQRVTAVSESNNTAPVFTDSSSLDNGWMLASSSDLLFWVPPYYRLGLVRPGNAAVIVSGAAAELDLTTFVYGSNWQQCRAL
ncbi:WD40 repeat-like protein [Athelia psychrophila]|uniref:WD40 repeat-like protein n=1 Tax=Athelia psychrophila TaxID=1759441 RepID=A0A165ZRT3_9AGAM|nr:WD40 repeat-like protein [Fibularhizoctonia sp. CBS 109695]